MTLTTEDTQDNQQQILTELRELKKELEQFNQKFDNYQKATQWVVQLAFSLIAAATVTVIVSTVLGNTKSVEYRLHIRIGKRRNK
jgi:ribulose 1,5-bisphosphate carboxylase large subunit-like protein